MKVVAPHIPASAFRSAPAAFAPATAGADPSTGRFAGRRPKLTAAQVAEGERLRAAGVPVPEIARRFGVSETTVYCRVPAPLLPPKRRPRGRPFGAAPDPAR